MVWKYIEEMPLIEVAHLGTMICSAAIDGMDYCGDQSYDEDSVRNLEDEFWRARIESAATSLAFLFAGSEKFVDGEGIAVGDVVFAIQDNMCEAVISINDNSIDPDTRWKKADALMYESFMDFIHCFAPDHFQDMELASKSAKRRALVES